MIEEYREKEKVHKKQKKDLVNKRISLNAFVVRKLRTNDDFSAHKEILKNIATQLLEILSKSKLVIWATKDI